MEFPTTREFKTEINRCVRETTKVGDSMEVDSRCTPTSVEFKEGTQDVEIYVHRRPVWVDQQDEPLCYLLESVRR